MTRAGRWTTRGAGRGRQAKGIAEELGCSWHRVNAAVRRRGEALIDADAARIPQVAALGLDETLIWRRGRYRTKFWATGHHGRQFGSDCKCGQFRVTA